MGLDTVELAVSFERYFSLEIPASVSERLYTVNDAATWFSQQLGVAGQRHSAVRAAVGEHLLSELPPGSAETTPLRQLLPDAATLNTYRNALHQRHGLVLPLLSVPPVVPAALSLWERLTGQRLPKAPHWHTQTMAALIDWTVAANYEKLLLPSLANQYEVEQAIIGMTSDQSGVPVAEIQLRSSFTNDLGMD